MKTRSIVVLFCTLSLLINACNMPGGYSVVRPTALPNSAVAIDMYHPWDGTIYSVGELIYLDGLMKVAFDPSQVRESSFLVNGTSVAANTQSQPGNQNVVSDATWTASDPGEYYLQAKVTLTDGSSAISEPHRICVTPTRVAVPTDWGAGRGYLGPCPLATRIPNLLAIGNVTMNAVAVPNVISFSSNCADSRQPPLTPLTFIAHVNDPQDLVALVRVSILSPDGGLPLWDIYLNWTTTRLVNQKEYRGTIQSPTDFLNGVASAHWQAKAYGRDGQQIQMVEGVINVDEYSGCHLQQPHPGIAPPTLTPTPEVTYTATPTAVMPPTFTLKINAFCRKGPDMTFPDVTAVTAGETVDILNVSEDGFWYFIHWKKFDAKCWVATGTGQVNGDVTGIKVLEGPSLPAPKPAEPVAPKPVLPPACTSYSDASSCTTHGCSWDKSTNSCK
jgi:hypothetical protein